MLGLIWKAINQIPRGISQTKINESMLRKSNLYILITWPNVRQVGRNFRPNISADLAENFGRIFGFGRTLVFTQETFKNAIHCTYSDSNLNSQLKIAFAIVCTGCNIDSIDFKTIFRDWVTKLFKQGLIHSWNTSKLVGCCNILVMVQWSNCKKSKYKFFVGQTLTKIEPFCFSKQLDNFVNDRLDWEHCKY